MPEKKSPNSFGSAYPRLICQNHECPPDRCSQLVQHQPVNSSICPATMQVGHPRLVHTNDYLGLEWDKKPFYIDFLAGKLAYRSSQAGLKREWVARALGVKPSDQVKIVDATAGLGRDSFILASLGFQVTLIERSCVLYMLLLDGLKRASRDPKVKSIIDRMALVHADAIEWLESEQEIDIIYMDPMFPDREKSASVKKEMRILQELLGKEDKDADQLFARALTCARKRVVVKRPRIGHHLGSIIPDFMLTGKNSRFDIYLTGNRHKAKK